MNLLEQILRKIFCLHDVKTCLKTGDRCWRQTEIGKQHATVHSISDDKRKIKVSVPAGILQWEYNKTIHCIHI